MKSILIALFLALLVFINLFMGLAVFVLTENLPQCILHFTAAILCILTIYGFGEE